MPSGAGFAHGRHRAPEWPGEPDRVHWPPNEEGPWVGAQGPRVGWLRT